VTSEERYQAEKAARAAKFFGTAARPVEAEKAKHRREVQQMKKQK
jgi:hypothetical protein